MSNLNGLDLELSQTKRFFGAIQQPTTTFSPQKPVRKLIERGDMIDSLDLNIGYDSFQKLNDGWGFGQAKK